MQPHLTAWQEEDLARRLLEASDQLGVDSLRPPLQYSGNHPSDLAVELQVPSDTEEAAGFFDNRNAASPVFGPDTSSFESLDFLEA